VAYTFWVEKSAPHVKVDNVSTKHLREPHESEASIFKARGRRCLNQGRLEAQAHAVLTWPEIRKNSYNNRFWELKLDGTDKTAEEIEAILVSEGCPSEEEVEQAFVATFGMGSDEASERNHVKRCVTAEARYWDHHGGW